MNWSLGALLNALSNALAGGVQLSRSPAVLAGGCRQRLLGWTERLGLESKREISEVI